MSALELLKGARALLAEGRWHQGDYECSEGDTTCFCAGGAIATVGDNGVDALMEEYSPEGQAISWLAEHLPAHEVETYGADEAVYRFNDAVGRTVEEVVALFDKAIAAHGDPVAA